MKKFFTWFIVGIFVLCLAPALLHDLMPALMGLLIWFIVPAGVVVVAVMVALRLLKKKPPQRPTEYHYHHYHDPRP